MRPRWQRQRIRTEFDLEKCPLGRSRRDGRITLRHIKETGFEYGKYLKLAYDRAQWLALILAALNLLVLPP
jgi:hypothetical protein